MKQRFKVGEFGFQIDYPESMSIPKDFQKFTDADAFVEYEYEILIVEELPAYGGELLTEREDFLALLKEEREVRYLGTKSQQGFYACYVEIDDHHAEISVLKDSVQDCTYNVVFTSLLALEKRLLDHQSMVLHTSYIEYMGGAILFSAPSETGKTTQSKLWEQYRGAKTINGDRALLSKKEGIWYAQGWPVCGTSKVCENIALPVQAIVMLGQAKENFAHRLTAMKAFSSVYSQITINRWDTEAHEKAMNLIEQLISEVPVWHLDCNISQEAVECLERKLYIER
ncbi:MAG: hypothetical protein MJ097_02565 [Dorea sp.]|nr:hypothetical protein [Dorea sp.]